MYLWAKGVLRSIITKSWAISAAPNREPPLAFLMRASCPPEVGTELLLLAPPSLKSLTDLRALGLAPCKVRLPDSHYVSVFTCGSGIILAAVACLLASVSWTLLPLSLDM